MRKLVRIIVLLVLTSFRAMAQGEENIWVFGGQAGLDFTTSTVIPIKSNILPPYEGCASICNASGQLLFYSAGGWVWNRNHELMPEMTGGISGYTNPVSPSIGYPSLIPLAGVATTQSVAICPKPFQMGIYYLFSLGIDGRLFYTTIDMSLNGGEGGIMAGKKGLLLTSGLTGKMTLVKGCNSIWLVVRSLTSNQYKSFEINDTGIITTPVISNCGMLPLHWYNYGTIKFSPDGLKMAAACSETREGSISSIGGGLELYDFNPYSGIISNAQILDSSSNTGNFYGACYSPDNSKLYVSRSSFRGNSSVFYPGEVRQYDVSLSSFSAVIASNTTVYVDNVNQNNNIGDFKRGKDGHIYFGSGRSTVPTMHRIDFPNLAGLSCGVVPNAVNLISGTRGHRGMPNDIVVLEVPDTVYSSTEISACFRESTLLAADSGKRYIWNDGIITRQRTVNHDGIYSVSYINSSCQFQTDSFHVRFIKLPSLNPISYSCPGERQGGLYIRQKPNDTTTFAYTWKDVNGTLLRQHSSNRGDTLLFADTGAYYVQITTPSGCDTTLEAKVLALPVPQASFDADSIVCAGVPVQFTNTSIAPLWHWYFGNGNFSDKQHPSYAYTQREQYKVALVVTNIEGCSDTIFKEIRVKDLELKLSANTSLAEYGELVYLRSSADEPYSVNSWSPSSLFADQSALNQQVSMDTTRTFTITGVSEFGCVSNASVTVDVKPVVVMPTAFSPNGDGLNDYFRPLSNGYIFVRYFEIFNRYGELIFSANGQRALQGWNGTYKGETMPLGVYYYHINIEANGNRTIQLKGDISLIR